MSAIAGIKAVRKTKDHAIELKRQIKTFVRSALSTGAETRQFQTSQLTVQVPSPVLMDTEAPCELQSRYLNTEDIGSLLQVSGSQVRHWIYRGKLRALKLSNGRRKVLVAEFEAFMQSYGEKI